MKTSALFITLFLFPAVLFAQSNTFYMLSGKHEFNSGSPAEWSVKQTVFKGKKKLENPRFASSKGSNASFLLTQSNSNETIYEITANEEKAKQVFKVRVFDPNKVTKFSYKDGKNPATETFIIVPSTLTPNTKVLVVMHGLSRNADAYIDSWKSWAIKNDYIVVAPHFDNKHWNGQNRYNLGNVLSKSGKLNSKRKWTFQITDNLAKSVINGFRLKQQNYDIFGHSAGGQFVNRMLLFLPNAAIHIAIVANPGWYTLPELETVYPYGLKNEKLTFTKSDLINWTEKNVFLIRGTADIERTPNLRQTPDADKQGKNRFERAGFMFQKIKEINANSNWKLMNVPGVGHQQSGMSKFAQNILSENKLNENN
ncbi:MAG: alpha/beta hydrolase family protein [Pyrinomonadaceae bacterium]